jgi:L-arabinose transport system araQ
MSMKKPQLGMSARKTVGNTVYHIFMVALSVIMIYPFIWSLLSSFKSSEQLYGGNPLDLWPRPFTMENYKRLFQVLPFDKFTVNSVFLSVAMPLCMIAVASLTAYALTRLEFRGRNILFLAFIATMMIPSVAFQKE